MCIRDRFKGICFIGLLSLLFSVPLDQKALVLIILLIFWSPARRFVGNMIRSVFRGVWNAVWGTTKLTAKATVGTGKFLFTGLQRPSGRFMPWWKRWYWFDGSTRGFLMDGHKSVCLLRYRIKARFFKVAWEPVKVQSS